MKGILILARRILPVTLIGIFLLWIVFKHEAFRIHASIGLLVFFSFILWKVPQWQAATLKDKLNQKDLSELEDKTRKTIAQIIGGFAILGGLYFTWMSVVISQEVQITDRFSRAIEFLGATDQSGGIQIETRLGGIYALERIARDSEKKDYWTIMELLCAYVRKHAKSNEDSEGMPLNSDVQTILTVIGRLGKLKSSFGGIEERSINLSGTNLRGANLSKANLEGANLNSTVLENADLSGANLRKASLRFAILKKANLNDANFNDADLTGAELSGARLINASFKNTVLRTATLEDARLRNADFTGAQLVAAELKNANLRGAIFKGTELKGTSLWGAKLEEAQELTEKQIESAHTNEKTKLK